MGTRVSSPSQRSRKPHSLSSRAPATWSSMILQGDLVDQCDSGTPTYPRARCKSARQRRSQVPDPRRTHTPQVGRRPHSRRRRACLRPAADQAAAGLTEPRRSGPPGRGRRPPAGRPCDRRRQAKSSPPRSACSGWERSPDRWPRPTV